MGPILEGVIVTPFKRHEWPLIIAYIWSKELCVSDNAKHLLDQKKTSARAAAPRAGSHQSDE
jgi:hypothetical protein